MNEKIWTTLLAPILVALVVGYLIGHGGNDAASDVRAEVSWLETPNPLSSDGLPADDPGTTPEQKKSRGALRSIIDGYRTVALATIKVSNESDRVSKRLRIQFPRLGVFLLTDDSSGKFDLRTSFEIESVNPGGSMVFLVALPSILYSERPDVLITHDGVRVEPQFNTTPTHLRWVVNLMDNYPFMFLLLVPLIIMSALFWVIAVPYAYLADKSIDFKAQCSSPDELRKMKQLLAHIEQKYPEKLAQREPSL